MKVNCYIDTFPVIGYTFKAGMNYGYLCICTYILLLQVLGKITPNGVYLEQLETEPWKYMPDIKEIDLHDDVIKVCKFRYCSVSCIVGDVAILGILYTGLPIIAAIAGNG